MQPTTGCFDRAIAVTKSCAFALQQTSVGILKKLDESLLRPLRPFRDLGTARIREILDQARPSLVAPEHEYFAEGGPADRFFLLLDGHIRVERINPAGDRVVSLHIPPGQLFGIASALGRNTYPATAVAATECLALWWPQSRLDGYTARYPGFADEVHRTIGHRFEEMNSRVMELATQQVEQRVACALLRLTRQNGKKTETGIEIAFPITRRIISEMTGSTLHTVSRLLSAWEKCAILESHHRHINILSVDRLEALSHMHDDDGART